MKRQYVLPLIAAFAIACGGDNNDNAAQNNGDPNNGQPNNAEPNSDPNNGQPNNEPDNANPNNNPNNPTVFPTSPGWYGFESRYNAGADSVKFDGQVLRQVLIEDLKSFIDGLTAAIDSASYTVGGDGSVVSSLDFYFRFDGDAYGSEAHGISTTPAPLQSTYDDISSGKDLVGKLAGNDSSTDHKDWSTQFGGWSDAAIAAHGGSITSPEGFVIALFEQIEENAIARAEGDDRTAPDGTVLPVHVTESGIDLAQLTAKFLTGAISLSQGADDYLDDDIDGKGLLAPNTQDGDAHHSVLEHQWDEGFGYFGAARNYLELSDDEIASPAYKDINNDGAIDLLSERCYGASGNAAKRDRGATSGIDLTKEIFEAFWHGRYLITQAGDTLTDTELDELRAYRDTAVIGWEKAIAATVIHYINDTIEETEKIGEADYDFVKHAKVWSEMKGFALGLQFNPHSPLSDADFDALHVLLADAPEITAAGAADYVTGLLQARDLMQDAYAFDAADVEGW